MVKLSAEGPPLERLLRRIAETPRDFLADPAFGATGSVHTLAVVNDLLRMHGAQQVEPRLAELAKATPADANRLRLVQILAWLLTDEWFVGARLPPGAVLEVVLGSSNQLAPLVRAETAVEDPERREELARVTLAELSLRPAGESEALATDRLTTLSSAERARVLAASRAAEERARAVREALARKAAQEAADKWSRE